MKYGTVTFFNNDPRKFFGFVQDEEGVVFFHWNNGRKPTFNHQGLLPELAQRGLTRTPVMGDQLVFWDEESPNGKGRRAKVWAFAEEYEARIHSSLSPRPGDREGMSTPEEMVEVLGEDGLTTLVAGAADLLRLTNAQIGIFIRNTPNGARHSELWEEFRRRQHDNGGASEYSFISFVREVMSEAGHPLPSYA